MFDSLFQKYQNNKQFIQDLNTTIQNLSSLRIPDWDNHDLNWFPPQSISQEKTFEISGLLSELSNFGIVESKNGTGNQIVYKLKPQYSNLNLVDQFDIWLDIQDQKLKSNIFENITNSTVIKNSTLYHSSVNQEIKEQNPDKSPSKPTTYQFEHGNKPTKNWQIFSVIIALIGLIFVILKHYNKI